MGTDEGLGSLSPVLVMIDPKLVYPVQSNLVLIQNLFILSTALNLFLFQNAHVRLLTLLLDWQVERISRRTVCMIFFQFLFKRSIL